MSFQAYLDAIEAKTGRTPQQLLDLAYERGFGSGSKAADVLAWLKEEHDLGRGHGMAFFHVLTKGPQIGDKHVGTTGAHRDEADTLRLDGVAARQPG